MGFWYILQYGWTLGDMVSEIKPDTKGHILYDFTYKNDIW